MTLAGQLAWLRLFYRDFYCVPLWPNLTMKKNKHKISAENEVLLAVLILYLLIVGVMVIVHYWHFNP